MSYRLTEDHCVPFSTAVDVASRQKLPLQIRIDPSDVVGLHLLSPFPKFVLPLSLKYRASVEIFPKSESFVNIWCMGVRSHWCGGGVWVWVCGGGVCGFVVWVIG